jgi:PAS domain S-box-containing protein
MGPARDELVAGLEELSALLDTVFAASPTGLAVWDRELRFVRVNPALAAMNGVAPEAHLGRTVEEVLRDPGSLGTLLRKVVAEGQPVRDVEVSGVTAAGDQHTWLSSYYPLRRRQSEEVFGVLGVVVDRTEVRRMAHRIEETVRLRTADLSAANQELETFSYSVSHDLRAPLRAVDGFSHALLEDHGDSLPPQAREYLDEIRRAAGRMAQLIDDLLQLSRVTRAPLQVTEVDLSALVRAVSRMLEGEVTLHVEEGLRAMGDERLLRIVFENLLSNAWKFTSRTARPEVWFGVTRHEGHRAFFVRDNGVGFDMRYAGRLFAAFQRLHSEKDFPGTGIGLATVQRIVRRHGGRVWASSAPGQGATIFFALE